MRVQDFYQLLSKNGIEFFCGVPDSLLKDICAYIMDKTDPSRHIITANEGNAIALASGYYLANTRPALVYMQNSGIGNAVNPLVSLADAEVYGIPMLLIIGWRGEPGVKDEPQHIKQGKITVELLETMGVEHTILSNNEQKASKQIEQALTYMYKECKPFSLIVQKDTFEKYNSAIEHINKHEVSRERAINIILDSLNSDDVVVGTTGQISREIYEHRTVSKHSHEQDFLTVGSMGHASSIAMGIAISKPDKVVVCMDGDGAFLMHMGALPVIASQSLKNFKHVVFNNEAHDSVGGQPTVAGNIDIIGVAERCGYDQVFSARTENELEKVLREFLNVHGTALLEVKVKLGARKDLGRPKEVPIENRRLFMNFLNK